MAPALETLKRRVTSGGLVSIMRSQFSRWPRHRSQQPKDRFVAEPSLKDIRDKAIFCVLLYSWCRVSALINLTVADYYERGGTRWLRFQEKRGKEHEVPVHFAGGGFAGVETIGSINDFLKEAIPYYPNLKPEMVRVVLVHPGEFVLPELGEELGRYTSRKLAERGVEIHPNTKVKGVTPREVELTDDTRISSFTLVWTAGTSPHPLLNQLDLPKERNRLKANAAMGVEGFPGVWALGDCAVIPDEKGGYQPPTAQHASREGKVLAHNIVARVRGNDLTPFRFKTLGLLASIGRRTGVARILGINFSGFVAWWLWRTIYLLKLPRFEKKLRVALDWTLDVFFSKDFVQYLHERAPVLADPSDALPAGRPGPANQLAAVQPSGLTPNVELIHS